jgi:hypothetical protein
MWGFWYIIQTLRNTTTKENEMTRNNHLRNKKDFDLNKSFTEWQINRANETYQEGLDAYNKRNAENSPFANKNKRRMRCTT